jgi:hypothetical protein
VTKAIRLDDVPLRKPADTDVLIPVSGKNESAIVGEQEGCEQGRVSEHERLL